ncbi:MAG: aminotransferase class III-fold pyridoxal phosphate-dependent enzyme [Proteobacteria bacterium]|nr:aminotransferase class III-fold pyridoxal phosphate-dependent enzyme [Pseudomonadota bacterium]
MSDSPASRAAATVLQALQAEYVAANPKSAAAFQAAKDAGIAGGTNRASVFYPPFPLTFVDAQGATVETADGQRLTDLLGNFTAGLFGFSPAPVQAAVHNAMAHGHALGGGANLHEAAVARRLTERFPAMELIRFTMTGTEANTYAINTALAVTGRRKILVYDGAYHGAWIHGGVWAGPLDTPYEKITVPYGNAEHIARTIEDNASDLAAVIMEPVMVNPTTYLKRVAPAAYLRRIREACDAAGCALIFDEVMTSRLAPGGAQALVGVAPDMTTIGKYFGGGLPFGAFGGSRAWMARHDPLHPQTINSGGTFNQNALSMAAAAAVLDELWSPAQCVAHNARGDALREAINQLAQQHGAPLQACGTGSLTTLIWQRDPVIGEVDDETVAHELNISTHPAVRQLPAIFWFDLVLRHDFLAGSPRLNYLTLPTPLSDDDYDRFLSALSDFFVRHRELLGLLASSTSE